MGLSISALTTTRDAKPMPLGESVELAEATSTGGAVFLLREGLDASLIQQLKNYSFNVSDAELQRTSDFERFGKGSYEEWYGSKERTMFALVQKNTGTLAAIAWFGPKPLGRKSMKHLSEDERAEDERLMDADNWHTIVYRSYPPFRGTGIMKDFVRFCMDAYVRRHPDAKLWAGIYGANPASISLATGLGFTAHESSGSDTEETIMVKE